MLVGNPGKIDGWIPPDNVTDIGDEKYNDIFEITRSGDAFEECSTYQINGTAIRLFNITGTLFYHFASL